MATKQKVIDSYLPGWSEAQYKGTPGVFNSSIAVDPDHSLISSDIRTSGMLVPVVYEKFSSSLVTGNVKWIITNPKNTLIYAYSDNPTGSALELNSITSLLNDATLQGYYRMTSGAVTTDSSTNGRTLTNVGTVTTDTGKFGDAADFGTANSTKGLLYSTDRMGYIGGAYSISFWIKMRTEIASGTQRLIKITDTTTTLSQLHVFYDYNAGTRRLVFGRLRMNVANDDGYINTTLGTSSWHHVVITYNGTTKTGYLDGVLGTQLSSTGNGNLATGYTDGLGISSDLNVNAYIDDVALFNKELSQAEVLQLYNDGGNFLSYTSSLSGETLISSPSSGQANGIAYYNNYIYLSTNTNIDRYGPLNGTPAYTTSVWTGATLGSQVALTNTVYGFQSSYAFPNHPMVVHGDGALYVCDYINGSGKIHRVKTTKTTFEGDTNNSSLYGALTLPFGFLPTDIQSYGTDLVILAVQTTDTVVNQGRSAMFFWDASATTFYKGPLFLPDSLATALEVLNGQLYIWSGNASGGVRLSKYIGGDSIQEVLFQEEGTPPPPGATSVYGSRIYWGNHITYPEDVLGVFAWGSKTERLPAGLHCVARATNTSTTMPAITAMVPALQANGSRNRLLVAWRDSVGYGIDTYSTTGTHNAVWRSDIENVGGKFQITKLRIPLGSAVSANMEIIPKLYLDDGSTVVTLPTISTTLYSGAKKIVYHALELNECIGQDNWFLELNWGGTVALPVTIPIIVDYSVNDDENISS